MSDETRWMILALACLFALTCCQLSADRRNERAALYEACVKRGCTIHEGGLP